MVFKLSRLRITATASIVHFDVPGKHIQLRIVAEALVEVQVGPELPKRLGADAWTQLDALVASGDYWEMLMPSQLCAAQSRPHSI